MPEDSGVVVTFSMKEILDKLDHKLDLVIQQLSEKASAAELTALAVRVTALETTVLSEQRLGVYQQTLQTERKSDRKWYIGIIVTILIAAVGVTLALANSAKGATPVYPLKFGTISGQVCDAQWLLMGKKPSVYQSEWFRVRKDPPAERADGRGCEMGIAMKRQIETLRWRLGQPKPIEGEWTRYLQDIVTGKKARPNQWVALATSRRTSGTVVYKSYPLSQKGRIIGVPFSGTHRLGNYQSDNAVDITCEKGVRVVAPISGRLFGGYGYLGIGGSRFNGQRVNMVGLYKARTVQFYLAHMTTIVVPPFSTVQAGETIGYCGPANNIWHLHMGATYGFPIVAFVEGTY